MFSTICVGIKCRLYKDESFERAEMFSTICVGIKCRLYKDESFERAETFSTISLGTWFYVEDNWKVVGVASVEAGTDEGAERFVAEVALVFFE